MLSIYYLFLEKKRSILFVKVEERKDIDKTHIVIITKDHRNQQISYDTMVYIAEK